MNVVQAFPVAQYWAYPKDLSIMFGYKNLAGMLKDFRGFAKSRPNYFSPVKPFIEGDGDTRYNVFAFAHYFENRALLNAGTRSLSFKKDLPRLIEAYQLHTKEVVL